jgi:hypothetical protein
LPGRTQRAYGGAALRRAGDGGNRLLKHFPTLADAAEDGYGE